MSNELLKKDQSNAIIISYLDLPKHIKLKIDCNIKELVKKNHKEMGLKLNHELIKEDFERIIRHSVFIEKNGMIKIYIEHYC